VKRIALNLLAPLTLLLLSTAALSAPGGQLPLKIITGEVEQPVRWGPDAPAFRRTIENPERLQRAIEAQERHTKALMRDIGVRGTAVGWNQNDEPVVKVYVDPSASEAGIPETLDGIPVEVEHTGKLYALNIPCEKRDGGTCDPDYTELAATSAEPGPTERHPRPVPIGVSVGHVDVTAGTLGCRVTAGCHSYALSNAHVFSDGNDYIVGENILQPGVYDGGINPDDSIAYLSYRVPIEMTETALNTVDAAIAITDISKVGNSTPSDGYGTPRYYSLTPSVNLNVMKYGRTTGQTYGYIDAINATVLVEYDGTNARFVRQIIIKASNGANFSAPGDSGSLVVASGGAKERYSVGLVFAAGSGITAANPINDVLSALNVSIDGGP